MYNRILAELMYQVWGTEFQERQDKQQNREGKNNRGEKEQLQGLLRLGEAVSEIAMREIQVRCQERTSVKGSEGSNLI